MGHGPADEQGIMPMLKNNRQKKDFLPVRRTDLSRIGHRGKHASRRALSRNPRAA